jgi:hypothetical protein
LIDDFAREYSRQFMNLLLNLVLLGLKNRQPYFIKNLGLNKISNCSSIVNLFKYLSCSYEGMSPGFEIFGIILSKCS